MEDLSPVVLNQSSLKAYMNCQRLYYWWRLERLNPAIQRSAPSIGIAVHAALAAYHADKTVEESVGILHETLEKSSGPAGAFEDKSTVDAGTIGEDVFRAYVQHYAGAKEVWSPLNQEIEFLVEVTPGWWAKTFGGDRFKDIVPVRSGVYLRGKADNLSFLKGALFLIDYKTAAKLDPRALLKYELDCQMTAYIYGLSKQLTIDSVESGGPAVKVEGAIIDMLVKTKIPQFARESFTRSLDEISEFELEFVEYGKRIREQRRRVAAGEDPKVVYPKNTEHCFSYSTCVYRDLCLKDTEVRRMAFIARPDDYVDDAIKQLEAAGAQP